jgi:hypothetical protein
LKKPINNLPCELKKIYRNQKMKEYLIGKRKPYIADCEIKIPLNCVIEYY